MERHDLDRDQALTCIAALSGAKRVSMSDTAASIAQRQDGADTSEAPWWEHQGWAGSDG